jgi:hypothetical protein
MIWDKVNPKSVQHLAIVFEYELLASDKIDIFNEHEYWETPQKSLFVQIFDLNDSLSSLRNWERWSLLYLKKIKGISIDLGNEEQRYLV